MPTLTQPGFQKDETVVYKQGTRHVRAVIQKVHFDDVEPYYTIQIDGHPGEKQTVASRLEKLPRYNLRTRKTKYKK